MPRDLFAEQQGVDLFEGQGVDLFQQSGVAPATDIEAEKEREFRALNDSMSTGEKFLVGIGKGMHTIGRGIGVLDDVHPSARQAGNMLTEDSGAAMAGDIAGMAAATLPAMLPISGAGLKTYGAGRVLIPAAEKLLTRIGLGAITGATEGAVVARGEGGDADQTLAGGVGGAAIGGAMEILIPVLGRMGSRVFNALGRKPKGALITAAGEPTEELLAALKESGTTFDALTDDAVEFIANQKPGAVADEVARLARFKSQGIRATKGDISQGFADQAAESRLLSMAQNDAAEPLRQYKLGQSNDFVKAVNDLVDGLGVPDEAGASIKSALAGRESLLRSQKNALYKQAAEMAPELNQVPIFGDAIIEALPDKRTLRRLSRMEGSQIRALQDMLVEFGLDTSDEAVEAFTKSGGEITPLTLGNLEDFRAGLNLISRADKTGAANVAVGPVLGALDGEADEIAKALADSGIDAGEEVLATLGAARSTTRQLKTEFSPNSVVGRLTGKKPDGFTPIVEASKVTKEIARQPVEQVQLTMSSLFKAGDEGKKAIADMQASVVLEALESALKAPSRKTAGIETVGGNQFAKYLDKFGDDRLAILFKGNEKALTALRGLKQTGLDMMPADRAVPKGSAPVILDALNRLGRAPGVAAVVEAASFVLRAGSDERAVAKAIAAKPEWVRAVSEMDRIAPNVVTALGLSGFAANVDLEEE